MGTQYLIDTNSVIEFLGNGLPEIKSKWLQNIVDQNFHSLSVINQIELLGYNGSDEEMQALEDFITASDILPLSDIIVLETIKLRKFHKIRLPDAIIEATAIVHNLTLVTRNIDDFRNIKGLNFVNPHEE